MEEILLVASDPAWPDHYRDETAVIRSCFAEPPLQIEHIGSTAVPGLVAKPVIDIAVLVDRLAIGRDAIPGLERAGYSYWAANPNTTKLFLVKGLPPAPQRTHHLHIMADVAEFERHVHFRDALRVDPSLVAAYQALKTQLADRFRHDREAYTEGKADFIDAAIARSGKPARRSPER